MAKLQIAFFGSPELACPLLQALNNDSDIKVEAVITAPDRPAGRKKLLSAPPIKELATKLSITTFQPESLRKDSELKTHLKSLNLDFLVVFAFGQILDQVTLDIPKIAPINIHGSLLPKYRGASPVEAAILSNEQSTGISIMKMVKQMDAGPVYEQYEFPISVDDTAIEVKNNLGQIAVKYTAETLQKIASGKLVAAEQDHTKATYCHKIEKSSGQIFLEKHSSSEIMQMWKAFTPWPGIWLMHKNKKVKILNIKPSKDLGLKPKLISDNKNIFLSTKDGCLEVQELQLEGKNALNSTQFLSGNSQFFTD